MRRADRLFQIIQILRRSTRPVTAARIAEELEVSRRTVLRLMKRIGPKRRRYRFLRGAAFFFFAVLRVRVVAVVPRPISLASCERDLA